MKFKELSFADIMATYKEKPSLPTKSNMTTVSAISYDTNEYPNSSKRTNWWLILLILALLGGTIWLIKNNAERIKKWLLEKLKSDESKNELPQATV